MPTRRTASTAVRNLLGGEAAIRGCRHPAIMADAGVTDFTPYAVDSTAPLMPDFFV